MALGYIYRPEQKTINALDLLTSLCRNLEMTNNAKAKRLDDMAAQESGLAKSQDLAAAADRLRRADQYRSFAGFTLPFLRN